MEVPLLKQALSELGSWRELFHAEDEKNEDLVGVFEKTAD